MRRHRTTARALLLLLVVGVFSGTAEAAVPRLAFPVVGDVTFTNDFGAPRWQGRHLGNDVMGAWRQPVIAVEAGRVDLHFRSHSSTCMLYLKGASGTTYVYIHLNNDLTARNDNRGGCREGVAYAPGLRDGDRVVKGELLGYNGDSGDADGMQPHLHFEIRAGTRVLNPYRHLLRAKRVLFPRPATDDPLSLVFRKARVVSVSESSIRIRTRRIKMSNGWAHTLTRKVTLAVPGAAVIERKTAAGPVTAELAEARVGQVLRVWTESFTPNWRTQRGVASALAVSRIYLGKN